MRRRFVALVAFLVAGAPFVCATANTSTSSPTVYDPTQNVTYLGLERNGIEVFLNIPYGLDTGGAQRFRPPRPAVPEPGTTIAAQDYGPACPQEVTSASPPMSLSNLTTVSEDCLNLNVARPKPFTAYKGEEGLPVMVYIHGGGLWSGWNGELNIAPDGLVIQAGENGTPVIHVAMNYRLGFFGFAQSNALEEEGSENAGLRDQRLALEWVRDNIAHFGGDPNRITIFGQSSGGLSVGLQMMAYGASKPISFQQAICESQALEPGITGNFTTDAMQLMVDAVGCNASSLHSAETVACLRNLDGDTLLNASLATYNSDAYHNLGDIWLPTVDGDFLPAAPSELIRTRRLPTVTAMIGWCEDDINYFMDTSITTASETRTWVQAYVPDVSPANMDLLLSLYPVSDFAPDEAAGLSAEFYRASRIVRDIIMTCQPIHYGSALATAPGGGNVYLYDWNQTVLGPLLETVDNVTGLGPIHTSEFAYVFGNLSHYDVGGSPFAPTDADWALEARAARSWASFATTGQPGIAGRDTFQGFAAAYGTNGTLANIFVVGGDSEGLSAVDGPGATASMAAEKLRERCAFINSAEMIEQLRY